MTRFHKALFTCSIATGIVCGAVSTPMSAKAASVSNADKAALKRAIVACKAEAKGKKIKWLSRRKYVNGCITEAMKDHPDMNVAAMLKDHPDLTDLPVERWPGF
jgi:pyruvate/2-oxoglutarate dehydrogenase complex dihydrolipoamide acyltransferase (E2) component